MAMRSYEDLVAIFVLLALALTNANAYEPSPLQDYCVATNETNGVFVNGKFCKDLMLVKATDFTYSGLNVPANTNNTMGVNFTSRFIDRFPAVNTLGLSISRADFAPNGGLSPAHLHPRATEFFLVSQGKLYAAFVTSEAYNYTLFETILSEGDGIVFPYGIPHLQMNIGKTPAVAYLAYNSQDPGVIRLANAMFRTRQLIKANVLTKALKVSKKLVELLQSELKYDNS